MNLQETKIQCPCCGETIPLLIDPSVPRQDYIEDCSVCCRPLQVRVNFEAGAMHVEVESAQ